MNRFPLATQVALIVVLALLVAGTVSLVTALDNRRDQMMERAVRPAAERIALLANDPYRLERRFRLAERVADRPFARRGPGGRGGGGRGFVVVGANSPLPPGAVDLPDAQAAFRTALADAGIDGSRARAVRLPPRPRRPLTEGEPPRMLLAVPLADGRWASLAAPGPDAIAPVMGRLVVLHLLIGLLILVPTLYLLHRVGRSMTRLTRSAEAFDGRRGAPFEPIAPQGPRDVASLIAAVGNMQARILAMLDEKDVMLGAIGHDLRTPLTAIRLEAEAVDDPERRTALVDSIEALHEQLEAILELARSDRAIDPDATIDLAALLQAFAPEADTVRSSANTPVLVPGSEPAIRRAIRNLLDNARRHGTTVDLALILSGKAPTLMVRDDGPGIPVADRQRLLQPFERGETSRNRTTGGHGLGLAIVDAIMRRHGGRLELADRTDGRRGLEARMVFPAPRFD